MSLKTQNKRRLDFIRKTAKKYLEFSIEELEKELDKESDNGATILYRMEEKERDKFIQSFNDVLFLDSNVIKNYQYSAMLVEYEQRFINKKETELTYNDIKFFQNMIVNSSMNNQGGTTVIDDAKKIVKATRMMRPMNEAVNIKEWTVEAINGVYRDKINEQNTGLKVTNDEDNNLKENKADQ